jgi:hypothetical protein
MVAMATYFPPNFSNQLPIFYIIIFKELKKISGMFTKCFTHIVMACHGNIFITEHKGSGLKGKA